MPCLTPQSAMFGFIDIQQENRVIINHLLLIFKLNVYKSRDLEAKFFAFKVRYYQIKTKLKKTHLEMIFKNRKSI